MGMGERLRRQEELKILVDVRGAARPGYGTVTLRESQSKEMR